MRSGENVATVRSMTAADVSAVEAIERDADQRFHAIDMGDLVDGPTISRSTLGEAMGQGLAWVAIDAEGEVGAFLIAAELERSIHVLQVSVHPAQARRGVGRTLLAAVSDEAARRGFTSLTLTTFEEVPWNAPYYRSLGFHSIPVDELHADLLGIRDRESLAGLDRWPRVVLSRPIP